MRVILIFTFEIFFSFSFGQIQKVVDNYNLIQKKRDEVYEKLNSNSINIAQADKIYNLLQAKCLNDKDFGNYLELYIYKSVDFYVPNEDYNKAIEVTNQGLKKIHLLTGITKDTIQFKLKSEIVEYYRRLPNQSTKVQELFDELNLLIRNNQNLEKQIPTFIYGFYNNYGRFVDDLGDTEKSIELYKQAQYIAKKHKITLGYFTLLSNISKYYREKRDYKKALEILNEAMQFAETNDKKVTVLISLSRCLYNDSQYEFALKKVQLAETAFENSIDKQPRNLTNILITKGEILVQLKKINQAILVFEKANKYLESYDKTQKSSQFIRILNNLSECYQQKDNLQVAEKFNSQSILQIEQSTKSYPQEYITALIQKSELWPENQIKYNIKAIEFANELRQSFDLPESKLFYSDKVSPLYEKTLKQITEKYNSTPSYELANQLLFVIESSKASTLLDITNFKSAKKHTISSELYLQEKKINQKIVKLQIKLLESVDETTEIELAKAKIQLSEIHKKIDSLQNKNSTKLKIISIQQIQDGIAQNECFLNYFISKSGIYCIGIHKKGYQIVYNPNAKNITETIIEFYNKISLPVGIGKYDGFEMSKKLYQFLLNPLKPILKPNLIISRHNVLGYVPFECLQQNKREEYLIENHSITYANSATLFFQSTKESSKNNTIITYSPFTNLSSNEFEKLQYSEDELGDVTHKKMVNSEANLINFRKTHQNKSVIHFATHAIVDELEPSKSFIAFYPNQNEFKLYLPEIYHLDLQNTDLVFLSACNTASGQIKNGEGMISITRAFQIAGCQSIISTIWDANDQSTALISQSFYKYIGNGKTFDQAIRLAKIDLLNEKTGLYKHPFYWANLILIGKSKNIEVTSSKTFYWYFGGIILILGLIISNRKFRNDKLRHH